MNMKKSQMMDKWFSNAKEEDQEKSLLKTKSNKIQFDRLLCHEIIKDSRILSKK